jgi:hypothetical protein
VTFANIYLGAVLKHSLEYLLLCKSIYGVLYLAPVTFTVLRTSLSNTYMTRSTSAQAQKTINVPSRSTLGYLSKERLLYRRHCFTNVAFNQPSFLYKAWHFFEINVMNEPNHFTCDQGIQWKLPSLKELVRKARLKTKQAVSELKHLCDYFFHITLDTSLPFEIKRNEFGFGVYSKTYKWMDVKKHLVGFLEYIPEACDKFYIDNNHKHIHSSIYTSRTDIKTKSYSVLFGPLQYVNHQCGLNLKIDCRKRTPVKDKFNNSALRKHNRNKEMHIATSRNTCGKSPGSLKPGQEICVTYQTGAMDLNFQCRCVTCIAGSSDI